jgi:scyllo-inositol 2-dehydrogenase (NADP+)
MPLSTDVAPVRVGVAGLGRAGSYHLERLRLREDSRVVALYDDCPGALGRAPVGSPCRAYRSWQEFLDDNQIELVLVAAPPAAHAELAIAALAAGKQVAVETPLCLNLFEADAIAAAAERSGGRVYIAQTQRWTEDFRTAQGTLATGELGEPRNLKLINWHYNPRARPAESGSFGDGVLSMPFDWRGQASTGGGLLWEFGVHYFDQLLQLAGRAPESVFARLNPEAGNPCDDAFLAIVNFSGGLTAHVEASRVAAAPLSTGWMISGELGSYAGFTQYVPNRAGEVVDLPLPPAPLAADEFYRQVVNNLRHGAPNPVPLGQARQTLALIEAVRRSARTGQVVAVAK